MRTCLCAAIVLVVAVAGCSRSGRGSKDSNRTYEVVATELKGGKIQAIQEVRAVTGLELKEAKDLVESLPKSIKSGLTKEEADSIAKRLRDAGLAVEVKSKPKT